jgi:hypothetical protein
MQYEKISLINQRMILGEKIGMKEQQHIVDAILSNLDFPLSITTEKYTSTTLSQAMYPDILKMPDKPGKLRLFSGEKPKTMILLHNSFELESARLLALWARGQEKVETVLNLIEHRLNKTCFGHFCPKGEGPGASTAVLRFWSAYKPDDMERQKEIVDGFTPYRDGRGLWRNGLTVPRFYLFSAFSECYYKIVGDELFYCSSLLYNMLNRPWLNEPYSLPRKHIVKNALSRVPGYEFVMKASFYIDDDKRWHTRY